MTEWSKIIWILSPNDTASLLEVMVKKQSDGKIAVKRKI